MNLTDDMWLRGQAAQRSFLELMAYNAAFVGNASVQAMELMMSTPTVFWTAMGKADVLGLVPEAAPAPTPKAKPKEKAKAKAKPAPKPAAEVVQLRPEPVVEAAPVEEVAEPVAVAAVAAAPVAEPAAEASAGPSPHLLDAPRNGTADDLTALKGVGAKLAGALNEFGIYHLDQIAMLDDDGIAWLNDQQPGFKMTCARYDLVEQAKAKIG